MKKLGAGLTITGLIVGAGSTLKAILEFEQANWTLVIIRQQHHGYWVTVGYLISILLLTFGNWVYHSHRKKV